MSGCHCDDSANYRVTGEVTPHRVGDSVGTGEKFARIRCAECGGKVAHIGSDLLNVLGIPNEEIVNGRCLSESQQVTLTVDLI